MSAPLTSQPVLELIYAIVLPASSLILFNVGLPVVGADYRHDLKEIHETEYRRCAVSGRPVYCTCILPCLDAQTGLFSLCGLAKITGDDNVIEY